MGNFYVNHTLRTEDRVAVAQAMAGRTAFIVRPVDGCIVVLDKESDTQDQEAIKLLCAHLSSTVGCATLASLNHDDDILWYVLYSDGVLQDEYDSCPTFFDPVAPPSDPVGGDAERLCRAFNSTRITEVESILRKSSFDEDGYIFALERHADLARALGLPGFVVGAGFRSASSGLFPAGLGEADLEKVI